MPAWEVSGRFGLVEGSGRATPKKAGVIWTLVGPLSSGYPGFSVTSFVLGLPFQLGIRDVLCRRAL